MIRLTDRIPLPEAPDPAWVKLRCTFDCYPDVGLFWEQDGGKAYLCMIDGNLTILNRGGDPAELREFVSAVSPCCVFSDLGTLSAISRMPEEAVCVLSREAGNGVSPPSDELSSREIYDLLNVPGLSLPEYAFFAVDFCRRINHGGASVFALRGRCAAFSLHAGNYALMNGIASHEKGCGTLALNAILARESGRTFLVCCRPAVRGFYEKNGFREIGKAGYWVRNQ